MIVKNYSGVIEGIDALTIRIETSVEPGAHFMLVGLPDTAVKESHYRVATALAHNGFKLPLCKIVVNMAPADIRKVGPDYDLPMAMGILSASGKLYGEEVDFAAPDHNNLQALGGKSIDEIRAKLPNMEDYMIVGELGLDGTVQPIRGVLPMALEAKKRGFKGIICPQGNAHEAAMVEGIEVLGAHDLKQVTNFFNGKDLKNTLHPYVKEKTEPKKRILPPDHACGHAEYALRVAAAGGHNILLFAEEGENCTEIAAKLREELPPMTMEERLENAKILSVSGELKENTLPDKRPLRDPHHTISYAALVGGGAIAKPGELTRANHGVLYLQDLHEFTRSTLEVLRQPLEDRKITIQRGRFRVEYPADFILVASTSAEMLENPRVTSKIDPVLLNDKMEIRLQAKDMDVTLYGHDHLLDERQQIALNMQRERFKGTNIKSNSHMAPRHIARYCALGPEETAFIKKVNQNYGFSLRDYNHILRIARTAADLDGISDIRIQHLKRAMELYGVGTITLKKEQNQKHKTKKKPVVKKHTAPKLG